MAAPVAGGYMSQTGPSYFCQPACFQEQVGWWNWLDWTLHPVSFSKEHCSPCTQQQVRMSKGVHKYNTPCFYGKVQGFLAAWSFMKCQTHTLILGTWMTGPERHSKNRNPASIDEILILTMEIARVVGEFYKNHHIATAYSHITHSLTMDIYWRCLWPRLPYYAT